MRHFVELFLGGVHTQKQFDTLLEFFDSITSEIIKKRLREHKHGPFLMCGYADIAQIHNIQSYLKSEIIEYKIEIIEHGTDKNTRKPYIKRRKIRWDSEEQEQVIVNIVNDVFSSDIKTPEISPRRKHTRTYKPFSHFRIAESSRDYLASQENPKTPKSKKYTKTQQS